MAKILIADDDKAIVAALKLLLKPEGYPLQTALSPELALAAAKNAPPDIALLDMNYCTDTTSGQEGLELIRKFQFLYPDTAIVAMTGWSSVNLAVECLQAGAADFIEKPWDNKRLLSILRTQQALVEKKRQTLRLESENHLLKQELSHLALPGFVAESPAMQALLATVEKVAASELNILLTGENGTGKSVLARYIHLHSARKNGSLITVNTGGIHESLFESEMFGHVKGAFTDAREDRVGRFELADGGTLFLDEIGNLPLTQQAKLLRVLEEKHFERVGSSTTINTDVRMIAATNADIHSMVAEGEFRQDLLYRLNTIELTLPPLRKRREDILPLARQMLATTCERQHKPVLALMPCAEQALENYPWPGNLRELQHVIERATVLCHGDEISATDLVLQPGEQGAASAVATVPDSFLTAPLESLEREIINRRIQHLQGNMTEVARSLGLSRSAFYRRLEKLNIK